MLIETAIAAFLLTCLVCFFSFNLYNILIVRKRKGDVKVYAEVGRPSSFAVNLAAVGTIVCFLEALLYLFLVFAGLISILYAFPFCIQFLFVFYTKILGLVLTFAGYFLFIWSVVARGIYAVSWEMPEKQKLVTWVHTVTCDSPLILAISSCFLVSSFCGPTCLCFFRWQQFQDITMSLLRRKNS